MHSEVGPLAGSRRNSKCKGPETGKEGEHGCSWGWEQRRPARSRGQVRNGFEGLLAEAALQKFCTLT